MVGALARAPRATSPTADGAEARRAVLVHQLVRTVGGWSRHHRQRRSGSTIAAAGRAHRWAYYPALDLPDQHPIGASPAPRWARRCPLPRRPGQARRAVRPASTGADLLPWIVTASVAIGAVTLYLHAFGTRKGARFRRKFPPCTPPPAASSGPGSRRCRSARRRTGWSVIAPSRAS